jgi:hypothetical protein
MSGHDKQALAPTFRQAGRSVFHCEGNVMNYKRLLAPGIAMLVAAAAVGSWAVADPADNAAAPALDIKLPEGWTAEDMQACMMAGTPGKMHEKLAGDVGQWHGKTTMWMAPGAEPMQSECTSKVTAMMDGRYIKCEMEGEMPGMGPYNGFGLYGFDNVSQEFVSTWIDNHSTGIMNGVGELSEDGKVLEWKYTANCPITKKPVTVREVETRTGPNSKTLEMFGAEPKSGKEFKMMSIELTRKT